MGYQVYLYDWPESQECLSCVHCKPLIEDTQPGIIAICYMNHDKAEEDHCSCFILNQLTELIKKKED